MNVGRVGLALTLLASFPLLVVPLTGTLVRAYREMTGQLFNRFPRFVWDSVYGGRYPAPSS